MIVSGRRGEKLVIIPTKRFDVPSGMIGNQFVGILSVKIEGIRDCQYNAERVIIFLTVPLWRVNGVYGTRNIHDRIDSGIELWNKWVYEKLVHDSHRRRKKLEGISAGPKPISNGKFSNLILKGK